MLDQLLDPSTPVFWIFVLVLVGVISVLLMRKFKFIYILIKFSYPNAKFSAMGNLYVNRQELERVLETRSVTDAMNMITSRDYQFKDLKGLDEIEAALDATLHAFLAKVLDASPKVVHPLLEAYLKKYEYAHLKTLLRAKLYHRPLERLEDQLQPIGALTRARITRLVEAETADDVVELLVHEPFYDKLKPLVEDFSGDFRTIDRFFDRYYLDQLRKSEEAVDRSLAPAVHEYVYEYFDITNLKLLLRLTHLGLSGDRIYPLLMPAGLRIAHWKLEQLAQTANVQDLINELDGTPYHRPLKNAFLEYMRTRSVAVFELVLDRYLLQSTVEFSTRYFTTLGPMMRFLVSKEYELRNLRTVLFGLHEGWPSKRVTPLLVTETSQL